jgi:catecholate siderophore receptor
MRIVDSVAPASPSSKTTLAIRPGVGTVGVCVTSMLGMTAAQADTAPADAGPSGSGDQPVEQVTVSGVRSLLSDKLPEDPQDLPQSLTIVTDKLMADQGATRLEDALKNVPGITLNAGEGAARGDTVNLRGFSAFNYFFLDGVRDAAVYTRDSFNLQSVEVLKGPSAVLFGRGSTGGAINQVSKAPLLAELDTVTANIGTNDLYRATADVNVPIGATTAFRINLMGESSQVAERDLVRNRRWGIAPSLAFGIGAQDTLVLEYLHQQENNVPDTGIPFVNGRPAPVDRDSFFGLSSDRVTTHDDIATARYKHDFNSNLSIADTLRYAHYEFSYIDNLPNFGDFPPGPNTPLDTVLVGRDAPGSTGVQSNLTNQIDLTGRFDTGFVKHTIVAGVEIARQTLDLNRLNNPFNGNTAWIAQTPLLDPNPYEASPIEPVSSQQDTVAESSAFHVTDTLSFGQHVDLIAGAR